jgi:hypothetical protein
MRSKMTGGIPLLPQYAFMAWCSVKEKHRDILIIHPVLSVINLLQAAEESVSVFIFSSSEIII